MLMQKKVERAMKWLKDKRAHQSPEEDTIHLEKNDVKAMTISAYLVFLPIALVVLLVLSIIGGIWFFL